MSTTSKGNKTVVEVQVRKIEMYNARAPWSWEISLLELMQRNQKMAWTPFEKGTAVEH